MKVLICGSSGQAALSTIKCLRLANLKNPKFRIITTDIDPLLAGAYVGDRGYLVKKEENKWIKGLNEVILKENINIVIPGHDIPLDILSRRRKEIKAPILLVKKEIIEITRDKWKFIEWLRKNKYLYPRTYLGIPLILKFPKIIPFPVIIKPRKGFGSKGQYKANDIEELKLIKELIKKRGMKEEDFVTQELLKGTELSGMVVVAKDGEILAITCAETVKRFGMSYKTIHGSDKDDLDFKLLAAKIVGRMHAVGPISLQGFRTSKGIKLFECNPRFTGAQIVRAFGGVNAPEILIDNWLTGKKSYPKITKPFLALWFADYLYISEAKYMKLLNVRRIKKSAVGVQLL